METVIKVNQLNKSYATVKAVDNTSFSINRGQVFGLLGANGAGKSTTVECILGTKRQDGGTVSVWGMDMFIFAICMPIVVIVFLGVIYGSKPAFSGAEYTFFEQSFGAVVTIAICAGGVMGLPLVISDYRNRKILKRFKVTPISPTMILYVHVVIYVLYAIVSLVLIYATAVAFFGYKFSGSWIQFFGAYFLVMLSIFSIGLLVGGVAPNTKMAGVLASILYFPMLIFSGATLPYEVMPSVLQKIVNLLPLTQGIKLLKATSLGLPINIVLLPVVMMIILALICGGLAIYFFRWE